MSLNFSSEAQEQQIDNGAHVTDTNNQLGIEPFHSRTELEMGGMFNPVVIGVGNVTAMTHGMETRTVDLEAQVNSAMTIQSQTSGNETRRESMLKFAGWAFTISFAALFSLLSANLRKKKEEQVLFILCTTSLVGAHLCSSIIIAMLLGLERYFPCFACALEVMCHVAFGFLVISGFLEVALLGFLSFQKETG